MKAANTSRGKGRPRRADGPAVTADAIVERALDVIQANGWSGLALREVARHLGVSLPAVQRHFATKDALWRACVDRLVADRLASRPTESPDAPSKEGLLAAVRTQLELPGLQLGLTAAMLSDRSEGAEERLDYLCDAVRPALAQARARIERAQQAGVVRPLDTEVLLALLSIGLGSLATGGSALRRLFGIDLDDPAEKDRLAAALGDIILSGIRSPAID